MKHLFAVGIAFLLILASGVGNGVLGGRWRSQDDVADAVGRLKQLPLVVGEWEAREHVMDERMRERGRIEGYLLRDYVNRRRGVTVSLLVVCGQPGPIAVHTPDVCYRGAGYEPMAAFARQVVPPADGVPAAQLWVGQFCKEGTPPSYLRIFWTWSTDGRWEAPDAPRQSFARSFLLYKLYLVRELPTADDPLDQDPALEFFGLIRPELQKALRGTGGP